MVLDSDDKLFGGFGRIDPTAEYFTAVSTGHTFSVIISTAEWNGSNKLSFCVAMQEGWFDKRPRSFSVYSPSRTCVVYALCEDWSGLESFFESKNIIGSSSQRSAGERATPTLGNDFYLLGIYEKVGLMRAQGIQGVHETEARTSRAPFLYHPPTGNSCSQPARQVLPSASPAFVASRLYSFSLFAGRKFCQVSWNWHPCQVVAQMHVARQAFIYLYVN